MAKPTTKTTKSPKPVSKSVSKATQPIIKQVETAETEEVDDGVKIYLPGDPEEEQEDTELADALLDIQDGPDSEGSLQGLDDESDVELALPAIPIKKHLPKPTLPGVVYLGRIPHGFYEDEMKAYFAQFGTLLRLKLSRNKKTGASKHYAFLEFESAAVATIVSETMDNYLLSNRLLKCKVVDASKLHESTFNGCEKVYKALPLNKIERQRHNKHEKTVQSLLLSDVRKRKELEEAGITYEFEGYKERSPKKPKTDIVEVVVKKVKTKEKAGKKVADVVADVVVEAVEKVDAVAEVVVKKSKKVTKIAVVEETVVAVVKPSKKAGKKDSKVVETPKKSAKTPEKPAKTPEKTAQTPEKSAKTPEKTIVERVSTRSSSDAVSKTPKKAVKTPVKDIEVIPAVSKTPKKAAKTPEKGVERVATRGSAKKEEIVKTPKSVSKGDVAKVSKKVKTPKKDVAVTPVKEVSTRPKRAKKGE